MKFESVYHHILVGVLIVGCSCASSSTKNYFTGAVFEHARQADDSPDTRIQINLGYYARAAREAKKQGADLIVFPEYGLFPPAQRNEMKKSLELIPNPKEVRIIPCNEAERFSKRPILYTLSCIAKSNGIVVVANMGGVESCHDKPPVCPADGELQYNANVAFDENGTIVGRYYKEHLFFESGMDYPRQKQDPIFETNFGKFAMFICFDIVFKKMVDTSQLVDVDAVLFPTMWFNTVPFFSSTHWFQAWSMGANATLLAANIQRPGNPSVGSGIFGGRQGAIATTYNPDNMSKLVVATIPKRDQRILSKSKITIIAENYTKIFEGDGKDVKPICSFQLLGAPNNPYRRDYRCISEDLSNYTLTKLNKSRDHLRVCNSGICCELDYIANNMKDTFYFGIYSGLHNVSDTYFWFEENCFLARCDDYGASCTNFPTKSDTVFYKMLLTANFTSKYTFPSITSSGMRLVPVKNWTYGLNGNKPTIDFNSSSGSQLLMATLNGRNYDKDPPYKN